jgi:hypothetical protein
MKKDAKRRFGSFNIPDPKMESQILKELFLLSFILGPF